MDSITQIVLGAAVGEACLGKKLGNKAMVWGGLAGTIPDMDIIGNWFLSELDALAFHRGISHSIFFSVVGGFFFGWLIYGLYKYLNPPEKPSRKEWQMMFFIGFLTHILLDCFTSYGTQIFAPFSYQRVAWGTISVVDPIYTVPFIFCLIIAAFFNRKNIRRKQWTYAGIAISSLYLTFTVYNKHNVSKLFEENLREKGIQTERAVVTPTIFNNQLWYCIVEQDSTYLQGHYSVFDKSDNITLSEIPKNHDWISPEKDDKTIRVLKWFSNNFYNVIRKENGELQINDLRFGTFRASEREEDNFVFRFEIAQDSRGYYQLTDSDGGPKKRE